MHAIGTEDLASTSQLNTLFDTLGHISAVGVSSNDKPGIDAMTVGSLLEKLEAVVDEPRSSVWDYGIDIGIGTMVGRYRSEFNFMGSGKVARELQLQYN